MKNTSCDPKETKITSLSLVPALENRILFATQNNHMYSANLKSEIQLNDEYMFEHVTDPVHFGSVRELSSVYFLFYRLMVWMSVLESR